MRGRSQGTSNHSAIRQAIHPAIREGGEEKGTAEALLRFAALAPCKKKEKKRKKDKREKTKKNNDAKKEPNYL